MKPEFRSYLFRISSAERLILFKSIKSKRPTAACSVSHHDTVERLAGYGDPVPGMDRFQHLRAEALSELRSWTDWQPLDDAFFLENVVKAAEALFDQHECDSTRLNVAVARSRACCAFLVSHLLMSRGLRGHL